MGLERVRQDLATEKQQFQDIGKGRFRVEKNWILGYNNANHGGTSQEKLIEKLRSQGKDFKNICEKEGWKVKVKLAF